jgi:hypothetical protein
MISRRNRMAFHAAHPELPNPYANSRTYYYTPGVGDQRAYPMGPMYGGPPPPAYGEGEYVPPYAPPEGGSKVAPYQGGGVAGQGQDQGQEMGVVGGSSQGPPVPQYQPQTQTQHPGGDLGTGRVGAR